MHKLSSLLVFTTVLACAMPVRAADRDNPVITVTVGERVNPQINAWAQGTITANDSKAGSVTIRGAKMPYPTEYAKMTHEIYAKTKDLTGQDRNTKEAEIRHAYADSLTKTRTQAIDKDSNFTFYLPKENNDGRLMVYERPVDPRGQLSSNMLALKDLKIGDEMTVGYEAATLYNYSYVMIQGKTTHQQLELLMDPPTAAK